MRNARHLLVVLPLAALQVALAQPPRPTPPTRPADGPGAPKWTVVGARPHSTELRGAAGANAPANRNGPFLIGPDYQPAPELIVSPHTPEGTVRQFTLDSKDSRFYPGTARDVPGTVDPNNPQTLIVQTRPQPWQRAITVYVPAQYKSGTKAPFIVVHDGPKLGDPDKTLPHVLDNLINRHRVPAMIAVEIQNGGGDAQGSERGLEYDTLSGKFAEFIENEVLPQVEAHYQVKLTHDPNGRAAMGCSSGAAAAFTMAWFHPEWYHRIISYSGTFVNQQWPFNAVNPGGAWDYHETLIPQAARKPLRVWMQVGDRDLFNPNVMRDDMHDWVAANHRMAAALEAKGYPHQYVFALDAGHCDRKVREQTLPEALEWTWRGYEPVAADLRAPDSVRAGLHKLASEYGDMSRKVAGERYDRLAHDSEEFQEEAATLRKAIAGEPADFRTKVESALASTLTASAHVADVSATHDKKQLEAALANLATVLEALNGLFPESVRVEPGTVEPSRRSSPQQTAR